MFYSYDNQPDSFIWRDFKSGSEEAYNWIYRTYAPALFNYGTKISRDRGLVKDCIQDLFITIWQNRTNLAEVLSIKHYLFKALRRELVKRINRLYARPEGEELPEDYHFQITLSPESFLIKNQDWAELQEKLLHAIHKLPDRQKEVIFLRFYDELSFEEIASIMTIHQKSVYKLVYKAVDAIQKHFTHEVGMLLLIFFQLG